MSFESLPLSYKLAQVGQKPDLCILLDSLFNVLNVRLKQGEVSCSCGKEDDGCFDCLRLEAEEILANELSLDGLEDEELEDFSDSFEKELDARIAKMVKLHKENV